jgi:transposase
VAKATFDAALLVDGQLHHRSFAMTAQGFDSLHTWIGKQGVEQAHACLEATGEYGAALALSLYEAGHRVSIVNPARIAADAKSRLARTKTDKADAALIAHFCCTQHPLPWTPPPAAGA